MRKRAFTIFALMVILVLLAVAVDSPKAITKIPADPRVLRQFSDLERHIAGLAKTVLPFGQRISLLAKLEISEALYRWRQPCTAANIIKAYLNETQALRRGPLTGIAETLYIEGRRLLGDLRASLQGNEKCSRHEHFGMEPSVTIKSSDIKHIAASMQFGEPSMVGAGANGKQFTQLLVPGTESGVGKPGLPGVPLVHRFVAVPRGATASFRTLTPKVAETSKVNLWPFQNPSVSFNNDEAESDLSFVEPRFVINAEAYASTGPFPSQVCTITPLGQLRDLPIAMVSCAVGQYYPASNNLVLFDSIDFDVQFEGGSGAFVTNATFSPFETHADDPFGDILNGSDVPLYVEDRPNIDSPCAGEELIIVTPTLFLGAADNLAKWKRDKGIATNVVEVSSSSNTDSSDMDGTTTKEEIAAYIEQRYDECVVRPSYVLLLGDAEFIPPFYVQTAWSKSTGTDYPYSGYQTSGQATFTTLPKLAVGRIPVDTLEQAMDVVNKIIKYESQPPNDQDFYQNASIVSDFECCRLKSQVGNVPHPDGWENKGFIFYSEWLLDHLMQGGYNVERIYTKDTWFAYIQQSHKPSDEPLFYSDGTMLPPDIGFASLFPWDGSAQDIVSASNAGRFLIVQRDHGGWEGWGHPYFKMDNINKGQLKNGDLLPVVFSISCSTALFDNESYDGETFTPPPEWGWSGSIKYPGSSSSKEETFFAEQLLRQPKGGVVGFIGATRASNDPENNALMMGLFHAVWRPNLATGEGYTIGLSRLGDILNKAKAFMLSRIGLPDVGGTPPAQNAVLDNYYLYHVIGDPTLEMWTSKPALNLKLSDKYQKCEQEVLGICVKYPIEGATITALQKGSGGMTAPIGRAKVKNGEAHLEYVVPPEPGSDDLIMFSASMENAVSQRLTLQLEF